MQMVFCSRLAYFRRDIFSILVCWLDNITQNDRRDNVGKHGIVAVKMIFHLFKSTPVIIVNICQYHWCIPWIKMIDHMNLSHVYDIYIYIYIYIYESPAFYQLTIQFTTSVTYTRWFPLIGIFIVVWTNMMQVSIWSSEHRLLFWSCYSFLNETTYFTGTRPFTFITCVI